MHTYHERMNRLLQLKNQYPIDLFNSFVARLRSANAHTCLLSDHQRIKNINFMHVCDIYYIYILRFTK